MDWSILHRTGFTKDAMGMVVIDTLGSLFLWRCHNGCSCDLRSTWLGDERGGVVWRGTVYTSEELQAGMRVQFGDWLTDWINRLR